MQECPEVLKNPSKIPNTPAPKTEKR